MPQTDPLTLAEIEEAERRMLAGFTLDDWAYFAPPLLTRLLADWRERREDGERPRIICLCGSTRFYKEFQRANYEETMAGKIVLSVGFYMHSSEAAHGETWGCTSEQKKALDGLHFRKIELADEVLILNVGGYIGESTGRELAHARSLGKVIRFLEPDAARAKEAPCPKK
jgi:hypothetical protein